MFISSSLFKFYYFLFATCIFLIVFISGLFNYSLGLDFLLTLNFVLYLYISIYLYRAKLLIYFDAWFVLLFPFYYLINSFLYLYYGINVFSLSYEHYYDSVVVCMGSFLLCSIILISRPKGYGFSILGDLRRHSVEVFSNVNLILLVLLGFACSLFFYSKVINVSGDILSVSRLELVNSVSDTGWYLKYFMIAYSWFILGVFFNDYKNKAKNKSIVFFALLPVFIYFYSLLLVGSRREVVFVLVFVVLLLFTKNGAVFSFKQKLVTAFLVVSIVSMGAFRHSDDSSTAVVLMNTFGEFIFPINTLVYYIHLDFLDFNYGSTYFQFITNFIPKEIFPDKPLPLAVQFAKMLSVPGQEFTMGYAFTPISEAFVNFGYLSIIIFPVLLAFFAYSLELLVNKYPLFLLILLSQVVNFQRSDVASLIFELLFLLICFLFCHIVTKLRLNVSS